MEERLINEESRAQLLDRFQSDLKNEVKIDLFLGEKNEYTDFVRKLLQELNEIDSKIIFEEYDINSEEAKKRDLSISPSLTIAYDKGYKIEYWGAPAGYETGAFIESIVMVSNNDSRLQNSIKEDLNYIDKDIKLYSFVTPTCPYCPQSTIQNHSLAIENKKNVRSICVEANEAMELSQKFRVRSVPQQNINDELDSTTVGVQALESYIEQILSYGSSKYDEIMKERAEKEAKKSTLVDNPDYPVIVTDKTFNKAIEKYPFVVVDCWADWCGPCKMLAPVIDELAKEQQGKVVFCKLDTDRNPSVSNQYSIRSIPTLLIFKDGEKVGQVVGANPKSTLLAKILEYK